VNNPSPVICIAVPIPIYGYFDYLPAENTCIEDYSPGMRVLVKFGHRELVGIVIQHQTNSETPTSKLKAITHLFDEMTALPLNILHLLQWCATYYCHPLGDCIHTALPSALRQKKRLTEIKVIKWSRTTKIYEGRNNATKQKAILKTVEEQTEGIWQDSLKTLGYTTAQLSTLEKAGYLTSQAFDPLSATAEQNATPSTITLNDAQQQIVQSASKNLGHFHVSLLQGVTGSGKTEIYIDIVRKVLIKDQQALILIPEINLTPQTLRRFQTQLATPIGFIHSGMSSREKLTTWSLAKQGSAKVIIGTRSAIFTPFKKLGLIIVDEEHDTSYKQMDGFKYSARDLAVKRAQLEACKVILGSATPSLESVYNAQQHKYEWLILNKRAGEGQVPEISLIDIRSRPLQNGCSQPLLDQIKIEIENNNQVIIFQNRRGFSPTLLCDACGWIAHCKHCDARLTIHSNPPHLLCHHCNFKQAITQKCESCNSTHLSPLGTGTERIEFGLAQHFPTTKVIRFDRDTIKKQSHMEQLIDEVNLGKPCLLVGTQMLAKGHDFHNVTLVAVIDADASFFSADFRAVERSAQLLLQVAGRSGRGKKKGRVLIQTKLPEHPLFESVIKSDYKTLSENELEDRTVCELPPFSKMLSIRADAKKQADSLQALHSINSELFKSIPNNSGIEISGPLEASMARKSDTYRSYLHIFTTDFALRASILKQLPQLLSARHKGNTKVTIDVDPTDYI
jgi:primosomal protein N' (replication factor Y)